MKKIAIVFPLILAVFIFSCGGAKGEKGIVKLLPAQIEEAIQKASSFDVDVELVRKGKAYDIHVDIRSISASEVDWHKYPPDKKVAFFALTCILPVGLVAIEHEENVELRNLVIRYKAEEWVLSMDDCVYFTSNVLAGTMNEEELVEELLEKIDKAN